MVRDGVARALGSARVMVVENPGAALRPRRAQPAHIAIEKPRREPERFAMSSEAILGAGDGVRVLAGKNSERADGKNTERTDEDDAEWRTADQGLTHDGGRACALFYLHFD